MRAALWAALALVGGGLLAHLLLADPGYVAMRGGPWLFETTLPVFLGYANLEPLARAQARVIGLAAPGRGV
jgi:hypothetical protein